MKLYITGTACANLASLRFSLERLAYKAGISRDLREPEKADKLSLPGVGTAATAMRNLEKFGSYGFIRSTQKPLLGTCLGVQVLGGFNGKLEQKTLGITPFETLKFEKKEDFSLPHMGRNETKSEDTLFKDLNEAYFYFMHSYCAGLSDYTIATCECSKPFNTAVKRGSFYDVQFHPERNGGTGELLLKNFILL